MEIMQGMITQTSYGTEVSISVRNRFYHADFIYDGEPVDIRLCEVGEETTYYIEDIAGWRAEEYIRNRRLEEWE